MKRALIFILTFVLIASQAFAQNSGEVEEAEIVIRKDRKITLPLAVRNFEKIPQLPISTIDAKQNYIFKSYSHTLSPLEPSFKTIGYRGSKVSTNPAPNYIKAGFGNYVTPYFETYIGSRKSENHVLNLYARHRSSRNGPVFDENSGVARSEVAASGKYFSGNNTISGSLNYMNQKVHFYGYNPVLDLNNEDIEQRFTKFSATFGVERSQDIEEIDYYFKTDWGFLKDDFNARENKFLFDFGFGYRLNDEIKLDIKTNAVLSQWTDIVEVNRNYLNVQPRLKYSGAGFQINAGVNYSGDNGILGMSIYPAIEASASLNSNVNVYVGYDGAVEFNTLESSVEENPFLIAGFNLTNTERKNNIYGGANVRVTDEVKLTTGFSYASLNALQFFTNAVADSTRFNVLFDGGTTDRLNIFGQVNYEKPGALRSALRFDFFNYSLSTLTDAWHRPDFKVAFNNTAFVMDNLELTADLYYIGGLVGLNGETAQRIELDDIIDLNFGANYKLNEQIGLFLQLNNLFGKEYQRYLNYPTRGLQVLGGLSFSF